MYNRCYLWLQHRNLRGNDLTKIKRFRTKYIDASLWRRQKVIGHGNWEASRYDPKEAREFEDHQEVTVRKPKAHRQLYRNVRVQMIDEEPELARTAENLLNKLVELTGILPDGLFVNGVKRLGDNPVAGGGFADVWKGEIRGTSVALKVIRVYDLDIEFQKDCYKEVIVWRNICHPNVMPFIGVNVDIFKPRIALISPWMDNGHMLCYLKKHPGADRQKMIYEISLGLHYLHSRRPKVIHGDLRANNVLIDDLGCARIGDFGLVRIEDTLTSKAGSSFSGCGSLRWQAPELLCPFLFDLRGAPCRITEQTDIYAFACVCLEAFTGQPPFAHLREPAVVSEVGFLGKHPSRPGELGEDGSVQDAIWSVMSSCWSRQPSERPSSSQVAETLETISTRFALSSS
ncbi:kinase-like protein [Schizopora paradoxa]|uniref:Kinase-like protein n=1 Tax=Schizopora paradoxa TaxID=27342 RepID=A0A0H2RIY3_9AGAM|nr:kinase-like protein [Schizopora paradoxa]